MTGLFHQLRNFLNIEYPFVNPHEEKGLYVPEIEAPRSSPHTSTGQYGHIVAQFAADWLPADAPCGAPSFTGVTWNTYARLSRRSSQTS